ncbi:hypothetical protein L1987_34194 [Smallanthus sonchifolius]|uniref:Uncharacterized protein n=1 Tax=Smallanthus sonchifolius TaxID=185202 RepID=A0ACB9HUJ4_9ASTR|nr:hypothetical protein L1987_34194 [Smallanthus sonchifolius]
MEVPTTSNHVIRYRLEVSSDSIRYNTNMWLFRNLGEGEWNQASCLHIAFPNCYLAYIRAATNKELVNRSPPGSSNKASGGSIYRLRSETKISLFKRRIPHRGPPDDKHSLSKEHEKSLCEGNEKEKDDKK